MSVYVSCRGTYLSPDEAHKLGLAFYRIIEEKCGGEWGIAQLNDDWHEANKRPGHPWSKNVEEALVAAMDCVHLPMGARSGVGVKVEIHH